MHFGSSVLPDDFSVPLFSYFYTFGSARFDLRVVLFGAAAEPLGTVKLPAQLEERNTGGEFSTWSRSHGSHQRFAVRFLIKLLQIHDDLAQ